MTRTLLKAQGLTKSFAGNDGTVEALKGVSLSVDAGDVLAFLGPNGAGKTTTIRILTGLIEPDAGIVEINGCNPLLEAKALQGVGTVLEGNRNLYWRLTALENLRYFAALKGMRKREATLRSYQLLDRFGLAGKERTQVQALSRGMQQKVAIAVALIHQPQVLLLDEPTLGLDVEAAREVMQSIRDIAADGCGILLTTHQLDLAEALSHRLSIIRSGEVIFEGSTRDIIQRFSGESYTIRVQGELGDDQATLLKSAGGLALEDRIVFRGDPRGLYQVLNALQPLPLIKVEKDESSLADVFIKLINEAEQQENQANVDLVFSRVQA